MSYNYNRQVISKLVAKLFNFSGRNRVKRRSRFVHKQNFRIYGKSARNTKSLLLTSAHSQRTFIKPVFNFVPNCRFAQRFFNNFVQVRFFCNSMSFRTISNIIVNAHWKRIRLLKNHSDAFSQQIYIATIINASSVKQNISRNFAIFDQIVHPVQRF